MLTANASVAGEIRVSGARPGSCTKGGNNPLTATVSCTFPKLQEGQRRFDTYYTNLGNIEYTGGVGATVTVYTPTMREVSRCRINDSNKYCNLDQQSDGHLEVSPESNGTTSFVINAR